MAFIAEVLRKHISKSFELTNFLILFYSSVYEDFKNLIRICFQLKFKRGAFDKILKVNIFGCQWVLVKV